jgi:replicative DNA helicase
MAEFKMPSALESERQVLGTAMMSADLAASVVDRLVAEDFYSSAHRQIFEIIRKLVADGHPIDPIVVMQEVRKTGATSEELLVLRDMAVEVLTPVGVHAHINTVRDKAMLRSLMVLGQEVVERAAEESATSQEVAEVAEQLVFRATERRIRGVEVPWAEATNEVLDRLEYMHGVPDPITGIPTGYTDIDYRLFGLQPGSFYIVAGRPGTGKTSFVTGAAMHAAFEGHEVAFFSLEMGAQELAQRMICARAGVSYTRIRVGRTRDDDWADLVQATSEVARLPIHVYDAEIDTVLAMASRARRVRGLRLVVVDYIQLAHHHKRTASKNEEVSEISRSLKLLARQLDVPVFACAQLNREIESRGKSLPRLSDLRDSGALEQDADVVMFLHRPSDEPIPASGAPVDVITAKNRNGQQGTDRLKWIPELTAFRDLPFMERHRREA